MRNIVFLIGIFFCSKNTAIQPSWSLKPTVCIAQQLGDSCELTFNIELEDIADDSLCLYLDGQQQQCANKQTFPKKITVIIDKNTLVELKNTKLDTLLSKNLQIKYQTNHNRRRRVRPPWSLF